MHGAQRRTKPNSAVNRTLHHKAMQRRLPLNKHQIFEMSYSAPHRQSVDSTLSVEHRILHVRSCAVHMSKKYHVSQSAILKKLNIADKYDHDKYPTAAELENAIAKLNLIKEHGFDNV